MDSPKTGPALIVCRDIDGFQWLVNRLPSYPAGVVIASDDVRVHRKAKDLSPAVKVVFLERIESFYPVADEVMDVIKRINSWMEKISTPSGLPLEVLFWEMHCEGGERSQKVQDILLLARSYQSLISEHKPARIVLVGQAWREWEDILLAKCASQAGLGLEVFPLFSPAKLVARIWRKAVRPFAKEIYLSSFAMGATARRAVAPALVLNPDKAVVVQLCSSARKHLAHTLPLLKELKRCGLDGVAMCFGAGGAATAIRKEGIKVAELEGMAGAGAVFMSWARAWRTWRRAKELRKTFHPGKDGAANHLLQDILWDSIRVFLISDAPNWYRHFLACKYFWRQYPAKAARLWTRVLPQAVIAARALPENRKPILFWQPGWPYDQSEPCTHHGMPVDFVYAFSMEHIPHIMRMGFRADQIVLAGLPWLDRLREFTKSYSKADSRKKLGIQIDPEYCVLCDPSYTNRGYMATAEQALLLVTLLELAKKNPSLHLIIKPHPAHSRGQLEAICSQYQIPNLTLVPKGQLPYTALSAADLLVTKFSTICLEGMIMGLPALGVLFDKERNFELYRGAIEYVREPAELSAIVEKLLLDNTSRKEWESFWAPKAKAYLDRNSTGLDANKIIAKHLAGIIVGNPDL